MTETARAKILVIEDNETTAQSICLFLNDAGFETTVADCGAAGLGMLQGDCFNLVVLDLNLPDIDGLQVCRRIRAHQKTPIIMLTARSSEGDIVKGLEGGAQDYVCKPFSSRELVARLRRSIRDNDREHKISSLKHGELQLDLGRRQALKAGERLNLTKSEFDLLAALMSRPGRVMTRTQLIEIALGVDFDGFDRTVDTHIWSIRKKLGDSSASPRFIHSELGIGYRFADAI